MAKGDLIATSVSARARFGARLVLLIAAAGLALACATPGSGPATPTGGLATTPGGPLGQLARPWEGRSRRATSAHRIGPDGKFDPHGAFDAVFPDRAADTRELRAMEISDDDKVDIIREARMLARAGGGEARIQLHPPQLGELSLRVTVTEHAVTVSIVAEHAQIADLMARHLPELRQALQATGLRFDNLELDARSAADNLDTFGQAADGEPRGYGTERQGGLLASRFPEGQSPLPSVPVNSLGTVDVTI